MFTDPHILGEKRGALGLVTLSRPKALNALTHGMVRALAAQLAIWAGDPAITAVAIRSAGPRGFCAGADIRALAASLDGGIEAAAAFLRDEYRLNAFIAAYPKPHVALLHGITMGGGAGLSMHARFRVADASLDFAMPETGIGFVVDVGATCFLNRAPGALGLYLALTGARIGAGDARDAGLVTHAVAGLDVLIERLTEGGDVEKNLAALAAKPPAGALAAQRRHIDTLFSAASVEAILERLDRDGSEFALETAQVLRSRSPTALKYTFRQMRQGRALDLAECLKMEYRMALRALAAPDFREGVRAALIDKDRRPAWRPAVLAAVTDSAISAYFAPLGTRKLDLRSM